MYNHPSNRPRFLSLTAFKFPLNAKLSALHRITGLMLIVSLLGYLALFHLILFHPNVTMTSVFSHCIHKILFVFFWSSITFHWLTGLRHILAQHFTHPCTYKRINGFVVSYSIIAVWLLITLWIFHQAWSRSYL